MSLAPQIYAGYVAAHYRQPLDLPPARKSLATSILHLLIDLYEHDCPGWPQAESGLEGLLGKLTNVQFNCRPGAMLAKRHPHE
jgi:hypothetical protein